MGSLLSYSMSMLSFDDMNAQGKYYFKYRNCIHSTLILQGDTQFQPFEFEMNSKVSKIKKNFKLWPSKTRKTTSSPYKSYYTYPRVRNMKHFYFTCGGGPTGTTGHIEWYVSFRNEPCLFFPMPRTKFWNYYFIIFNFQNISILRRGKEDEHEWNPVRNKVMKVALEWPLLRKGHCQH